MSFNYHSVLYGLNKIPQRWPLAMQWRYAQLRPVFLYWIRYSLISKMKSSFLAVLGVKNRMRKVETTSF